MVKQPVCRNHCQSALITNTSGVPNRVVSPASLTSGDHQCPFVQPGIRPANSPRLCNRRHSALCGRSSGTSLASRCPQPLSVVLGGWPVSLGPDVRLPRPRTWTARSCGPPGGATACRSDSRGGCYQQAAAARPPRSWHSRGRVDRSSLTKRKPGTTPPSVPAQVARFADLLTNVQLTAPKFGGGFSFRFSQQSREPGEKHPARVA